MLCDSAEDASEGWEGFDVDDRMWESVTLPHTPKIEPLVVNDQWQGLCWYRKHFVLDPAQQGKKIIITFEAAMQVADVWINGRRRTTHFGGYLPFWLDLTDDVEFGKENVLSIRLDNRDNPEVPPGKPLKELDFCMYGGLYRNVSMHILDRLHITDAVQAGKPAGGGVFVRYPVVSDDYAQVRVETHIINEYPDARLCRLTTRLLGPQGALAAEGMNQDVLLGAMKDTIFVQFLDVPHPSLWHPDSPSLYQVLSIVSENSRVTDSVKTRIGIRHVSFDAEGAFRINQRKFAVRGTNRHQEYPFIGNALPDNAQRRDAVKIKRAGFDLVRTSHYPQAPSFLDACDELGILVMDAIPGWQFLGNDTFQQRSFQDIRDMIRRDRNHPSVVLWEVSLNESDMTSDFMRTAHNLAHQEYPGDQCFTCGWKDAVYDIFIPARQHADPSDRWRSYRGKRPLFISEYGDWEYYAQNAGFNQPDFRTLSPEERNSRQRRGNGEKRLLQQALNFQEAFNDNLKTPAFGCANWLAFDYNRGYADDIETSGVFDIFRIPKYSYSFFQSQRSSDLTAAAQGKIDCPPMVFIASAWTASSDLRVKVFSNCQRITLSLNGREIATRDPDQDIRSSHLSHPPFTFPMDRFQAGTLEAVGWIDGRKAASHSVTTPSPSHALRLAADLEDIDPKTGTKDAFFVRASVVDAGGTLVPSDSSAVFFHLSGPGVLIGPNPTAAEAGIATILVETSGKKGKVEIEASVSGLKRAKPIALVVR
jgi:beta-galactosidase